LRLHFAGTTYARDSAAAYQVLPIAREIGIGALVTELPARIAYLDALQVLLDSHATVVLGSDQPHYTASKLFPYILAGKPLLAIFHEQSSAVKILQTTHAGHVITFGTCSPICGKSVMVQHWLAGVLSENGNFHPATDWNAFEACTTRAMSGRLAGALEKALTKAGQGRSAAAGFV
jgi:hypothetical protein